jgi:hypothetical protein
MRGNFLDKPCWRSDYFTLLDGPIENWSMKIENLLLKLYAASRGYYLHDR